MAELVYMPKADYDDILAATRERTGKSDLLKSGEVGDEIRAIPSGGGVELPALSNPATSAELRAGYELIDANGNVVTGAMPTVSVPFPTITYDEATRTITATVEQEAGYTRGGGAGETYILPIIDGDESSENLFLKKIKGELTAITAADLAGVTTLSNYAFAYFQQLASITLPETITAVGDYWFYYCTALTSVAFSGAVTAIRNGAFKNCTALETFSIPSTVTEIGQEAFYACSKLKSVTLPEGLVSLGAQAFVNCSSLESIEVPSGITEVGSMTFYGCKAMESIVFKGDITKISSNAFYNCSACLLYDFTACTSVPTLEAYNCFSGTNANAEIRVPSALYDEWIAATNWSYRASQIVAG